MAEAGRPDLLLRAGCYLTTITGCGPCDIVIVRLLNACHHFLEGWT